MDSRTCLTNATYSSNIICCSSTIYPHHPPAIPPGGTHVPHNARRAWDTRSPSQEAPRSTETEDEQGRPAALRQARCLVQPRLLPGFVRHRNQGDVRSRRADRQARSRRVGLGGHRDLRDLRGTCHHPALSRRTVPNQDLPRPHVLRLRPDHSCDRSLLSGRHGREGDPGDRDPRPADGPQNVRCLRRFLRRSWHDVSKGLSRADPRHLGRRRIGRGGPGRVNMMTRAPPRFSIEKRGGRRGATRNHPSSS